MFPRMEAVLMSATQNQELSSNPEFNFKSKQAQSRIPGNEIAAEISDITNKLRTKKPKTRAAKTIESKVESETNSTETNTPPSREEFLINEFYTKSREAFKKFLSDYLSEVTTSYQDHYSYQYSDESSTKLTTWADEAFTYKERMDVVRKIMMNELFGAGNNHISPDEMERYKMWTKVLKANQQLSFIYRDSIVN